MNVGLRAVGPLTMHSDREHRSWLNRCFMPGVAAVGLLAEGAAILVGSAVAAWLLPGLASASELVGLTVAYLLLSGIAMIIRQISQRQENDASWLLWLALILGLFATRSRDQVDIAAFVVWFLLSACCVVAVRAAHDRLTARVPARYRPRRAVAFIGNSFSASMMLAQMNADLTSRIHVVGYFDDRLDRPGPLSSLLPCLGTVNDLVSFIHEEELHEVYMALPWSAGARISQLLERLRFLPLTVKLVPDHVPPALPGRGDGQFQGVVMPTLMLPPFSAAGAVFKRTVDVVGVCVLLLPLVPLFLVVAILIKLDSRGPVMFRQMRSGQYGRQFSIFKFRTLHVAQADTSAETLVTAGDRRVTRVGRYLRKYSIDELPQVFNVLFGHMSLVGPRPHAPRAKADGRIYAEVIPEYMLRYRVKPGMTGWAQVNGWRGNTDTEEQLRKRVEFDFQYIGKWSPLRDIEIMIKTIPSMLLPPAENV